MASRNENLDPAGKSTPLTPELREWALRQHTDAEILEGLREAREQDGAELGELIRELEQEVQTREQRPSA